jgi:hypothetical protein
VQAIGRKLVRGDVVPEIARRSTLGQQFADEVVEMMLRLDDVLASMQACREFGAVMLVRDELGFQHSFEPLAGVASPVPGRDEMFEVTRHPTFMSSDEDRFGVRKYL